MFTKSIPQVLLFYSVYCGDNVTCAKSAEHKQNDCDNDCWNWNISWQSSPKKNLSFEGGGGGGGDVTYKLHTTK